MRMLTRMPLHMHAPHTRHTGSRRPDNGCSDHSPVRGRMGLRAVEAGATRTLSMHTGTRQQQRRKQGSQHFFLVLQAWACAKNLLDEKREL